MTEPLRAVLIGCLSGLGLLALIATPLFWFLDKRQANKKEE